MSLCRSCTRDISPEEQVIQYVKVGACMASVMVCVWCFSGRRKSEPIAHAAQPKPYRCECGSTTPIHHHCGIEGWRPSEDAPCPACAARRNYAPTDALGDARAEAAERHWQNDDDPNPGRAQAAYQAQREREEKKP